MKNILHFKKYSWVVVGLLTLMIAPVSAQNVPALTVNKDETVNKINLMSPNNVLLNRKEIYSIRLVNEWKSHPDRPHHGADGSVKYLFGATLPTLICTPLEVCSIVLQEGEVVNDVHAGDNARWKITPATIGNKGNPTTVIVIKPTDAGLVTNLSVATDRRLYTIKLVSTQNKWIPILSFDYPDDVAREWAAYHEQHAQQVFNTTLPTGQNIANLDFGFCISGDNPRWKPIRVYTDGSKTYIQFSSASFNGDAPALVERGNDGGLFTKASEMIVNYRVIGDRYVVDKVLERASLIVGVGRHQTEVTITRTEGK
ncbi:MAG: P-type conjugative transfer protein TrbG [Gammaproteobacteria bacterium]